jgi:FdhE protein
MIHAAVPPEIGRLRQKSGAPWFDPGSFEPGAESAERVLRALLDDLAAASDEPHAEVERLRTIVDEEGLTALELLLASAAVDPTGVDELADRAGVPRPVLRFVAAYLARPFLEAATREFRAEETDAESAGGDCPACGHPAALAFIHSEEGQRSLWCRSCGTRWPVRRLRCPFCRNTDARTLGYFVLEGQTGLRVDFCRCCRRYLKTVDLRETGPDFAGSGADYQDLATGDLDVSAVREGFLPAEFRNDGDASRRDEQDVSYGG